jgi:hypothetical protein
MNIPQQKEEPQRTRRDAKETQWRHKEQIKLMSPNDTRLIEKALGENANLITAKTLETSTNPFVFLRVLCG